MPIDFASRLGEEQQQQPVDFAGRMAEKDQADLRDTAESILRGGFDRENFAPPRLRVNLSRGDTLEEKRLRLKKEYPGGDVMVIEPSVVMGIKEPAMFWRESEESQWKLTEKPGFDRTDILEAIAPSFESILGETAAAVATGGGSIPATVARQALGAMAGETIEQLWQSLTGVQSQSIPDQAGEVFMEGGLSAAGGFAASPFVGVRNVTRGAGILQVGEEGIEALEAADRIGIKELLTAGLVSDNPIIQRSEAQARDLLPAINRRYRKIAGALNAAVTNLAPAQSIRGVMRSTVRGLKTLSDETLIRLGTTKVAASEGGEALGVGIAKYDAVANQVVDDLYGTARNIEEPVFDFIPLQNLAKDLRAGTKGKLASENESLLKQIEDIKGPIPTSDGGAVEISQQLRNIRTQAYANKFTPEGAVSGQAEGQASDIYKALNKVLDNPTNTSTDFVDAWKAASTAARERFDTLEKAAIIKAAKSQNPAELVASLARPRQVGNLITLRDTIPGNEWDTFTQSVYSDWLEKPAGLSRRLEAFDQETLDVLVPRAEQAGWKKVAREIDRISSVGADTLAEVQVKNANFIDSLMSSKSPRDIHTVIKGLRKVPGGVDSFRAGAVNWAWDGVIAVQKGKVKVDRALLVERMKALRSNGTWAVLSQQQRQVLSDVDKVARQLQAVADAGTSIRSAEATSGAASLQISALKTILQSNLIGNFALSAPGRAFLIGSGKANSRGEVLRVLGAALTQTSKPEDMAALLAEQEAQ